MNWASFWTLVAVGVVSGLIVAVVVAGPPWYRRRRKRQAKEAEAERIRRMTISVGGHIVATELRWNAGVAKRCEDGGHVPTELKTIRLWEWRARNTEMAGLRDEAPELWQELVVTYADLDGTRHGLADLPQSDYLLSLADRLDAAAGGR